MKSNNNTVVRQTVLRFLRFLLESSSSVVSGVIQTTCGMFFFVSSKFGVIAKIFFNQLENKLGCSFSFKHYTLTRHNNNEKSLILYTKQQQIMSQNSSNDYLSVIYTGSIVLFTLALKGERIMRR